MSILDLSAVELSDKIKKGEVKVREAVEAVFAQIEESEKTVHAYVTLDKEKALKEADEVQEKIDKKELTGPLAGVPLPLKITCVRKEC